MVEVVFSAIPCGVLDSTPQVYGTITIRGILELRDFLTKELLEKHDRTDCSNWLPSWSETTLILKEEVSLFGLARFASFLAVGSL